MPAAFPFSAIVGQDEMVTALLISAVDPGLGGVLVLGHRGTGKSTAVRGLPAILPSLDTVKGCPVQCRIADPAGLCGRCTDARPSPESRPAPVVDLPLGTTEDRLVGGIDLEAALASGERRFEPGLLARANRGYLYVDEINLLDDHLVDLLLDVAASGENIIEREGMSLRHPASFVLIGSGNPEEGDLRPQLLDRFGLCVQITTPKDLSVRVEVVRRRGQYDDDPGAFSRRWRSADGRLRKRVERARASRDDVCTPDPVVEAAASICIALGIDGLRGELTLVRAARALAAIRGETVVPLSLIAELAPMALRHRLRRDPLDESGSDARIQRALDEVLQ